MMNNCMYCIIISHRNTLDLLIRCVASIPRREDVQIIVVNDNSEPAIVDFDNFPIKIPTSLSTSNILHFS